MNGLLIRPMRRKNLDSHRRAAAEGWTGIATSF
jgi:hypothetical protein